MSKLPLSTRVELCAGLALAALLTVGCQTDGSYRFRAPTEQERAQEAAAVLARSYDVDHYAIDIVLHPATRRIEGTCSVRFLATRAGVNEIALDLVDLDVISIVDGAGRPLGYRHDGKVLTVKLAEPIGTSNLTEVVVEYGGAPSTGLWFSGERPGDSMPTQVFTQGEAEHSRGWFPCFDQPSDRATSEVSVTMPSEWVSFAPGERVGATESGSARTERWRMDTPHPSYLVSLVAGEFAVTESDWNGVPLSFAVAPEFASWAEASFHETDEILTFLSDYTSIRYPYPKYSQVCVDNFPYGGMENISATTLTPLTLGDERAMRDEPSTSLVAHEAAHQWFGDLFTCKDWSHIWLNEGFATYMTMLYFEETRGVDDFRARMRDAQDDYTAEDRGAARRSTVSDDWKDPEDLMDTRAYQGGAARLHLLRFMLGDDVFRAGIRTYASENAGRSVETDDFRRAMEKVSGRDLQGFFDQWIYGRGFPEFEMRWEWNEIEGVVNVSVRQTQDTADGTPAIFRVPVEIEIRDEAGAVAHRVELTRRSESFEFPVAGHPVFVRFDKNGWIPKHLSTVKRAPELLAIANEDEDVNGRRDAIRALGEVAADARIRERTADVQTIIAELTHALATDTSAAVRATAATALGAAQGLEARERLLTAVRTDTEARVRVAALNALAKFAPSPELLGCGREAFAAGYSWKTMGAAAGLVIANDPAGAYTWLTEKLFVDSPHDVLRADLLAHLGGLATDGVDDQLRRWANDESSHARARAAAIEQIGKRRRQSIENSRFVAKFLDEPNFRLRRAAVEALSALGDDSSRRALRAYYPRARTAAERRVIEAASRGAR